MLFLNHEDWISLSHFSWNIWMDLFTRGPDNFGRTEKLKHMIDTSRYQLIHLEALWISLVDGMK